MELRYKSIATTGERIVGFIIDYLIISVVSTIGSLMLRMNNMNTYAAAIMISYMVFILLVFCFKDGIGGQSIGKRLFQTGVRDSRNPDVVPSKGRLFLRNLILFIWPVEFFVMTFSKRGQRLGDILAKTVVVKLEKQENLGELENSENIHLQEYMKNYEQNPNSDASENKIVKRAAVIVMVFVLLIVVFVSGIAMSMKKSDAYTLAIDTIESTTEISDEIGEISGYGFLPMGSLSIGGDSGDANFTIKVKGETGDCRVAIVLSRAPGEEWKVDGMRVYNK